MSKFIKLTDSGDKTKDIHINIETIKSVEFANVQQSLIKFIDRDMRAVVEPVHAVMSLIRASEEPSLIEGETPIQQLAGEALRDIKEEQSDEET